MSVYDPLRKWLVQQGKTVTVTFGELEKILGRPLPYSASHYSSWWDNEEIVKTNHVQAKAWHAAGYRVTDLKMIERVVTFKRQ